MISSTVGIPMDMIQTLSVAVAVSVLAAVTDFVPCWTVCWRRWTVSRGCRAVCGGCRRVGRTKENKVRGGKDE